jgi:acetoin utilization deacetylase AcuC-like enzyme
MHTVYNERHKLHRTDGVLIEGHPLNSQEVPARAEAILAAIRQADLGPVVAPVDHGLAPILAVHDAEYVAFLREVYAESAGYFGEAGPVSVWTFASRHAMHKPANFLGRKGYYAFGWGSPILEGTWQAAYWSAQCALTAAGMVREGSEDRQVAYALCRPPGHHAGPDLYGGYCYLNNAAIAARYLQAVGGQVAVLDVDYHHGNGTQLIFYDDPAVLFCSLHVDPDEDYPHYWGAAAETGRGPGLGTNRNWPLPRGTGDGAYLAALDEALAAIEAFLPATLVVSAGLDTVEGDPEGGFCLSSEGLGRVGRAIGRLGLPTVVVQEGGYLLNDLGRNALILLQALVDER